MTRAPRSILVEQRGEASEWVDVLPAVQWVLNTAFRRYGSTPYHVIFGRAPRTSFSVLRVFICRGVELMFWMMLRLNLRCSNSRSVSTYRYRNALPPSVRGTVRGRRRGRSCRLWL